MALTENELRSMQENLKEGEMIIVKFTASWCGPCQTIRLLCESYEKAFPPTIKYIEIDIDESIELYSKFKRMKMLNGVPALFAFYAGPKEYWYIPDDVQLNSDKTHVTAFFERCLNRVLAI